MIRDLIATVDRERAKLGIFVTLAKPTKPMVSEAAAAGLYESPLHGKFPKIQILTTDFTKAGSYVIIIKATEINSALTNS